MSVPSRSSRAGLRLRRRLDLDRTILAVIPAEPGLFVPKPSTGWDGQRPSTPELGETVRERPLASTAVGGDCYSLGYSVAREWSHGGCASLLLDTLLYGAKQR